MKPDYEEIAARAGIRLPPLGPLPGRWPAPWRTLSGPVWHLPTRPGPFLAALLARRATALTLGVLATTIGTVSSALIPWAMGRALDAGLAHGLGSRLGAAVAVLLLVIGLVAVGDALTQMTEITTWMGSSVGATRALSERTADRVRALARETTPGEMITAVTGDAIALGRATALIPELVASAASTVLVAVLMLRTSTSLGLVVLIGMPLLFLLLIGIAKPLEARQSRFRAEQSALTTISTDAVQGLRILRGIGGEDVYSQVYRAQSQRVRDAGARIAPTAALLAAIRSAAPMLLSVLVVAQGAVLVADGAMSVGDLLAFYGYTTFLRHPVWIVGDAVEHMTRAWIAARRAADLLAVAPIVADPGDEPSAPADTAPPADGAGARETEPRVDWARAALVDPVSAARIDPGILTVVLAPSAGLGLDLCRRLARVDDSLRPALVDGAPTRALSDLPVDEVRRAILLNEETPQLFAGTLRDCLLGRGAPRPRDPGTTDTILRDVIDTAASGDARTRDLLLHDAPADDAPLLAALDAAAATDALDSLDGGLDGLLDEAGRNLSGGQRQRVALARAYAHDPAILLLVDPTSALDSHTEALIARRLPGARRGRTTVVVTDSPLLARAADRLVVLDEVGRSLGSTDPSSAADPSSDDPAARAARAILDRRGGRR
ncbi:ABC transporter transmembrane domain-containing protein [Actinomyces sp. B33]|uniref:ABC transporter transmembrane domain-containing protein n=1 Tax=Actinomyces sp. B33 TaxID=2942131 RepID=UPI002341A792|nr:ABC transporter ATP-binding protein [Actinomyces sp. B33]